MPHEIDDLHAQAVTVPCKHCGQPIGQPCINPSLDDKPPTRIPHTARLLAAEEVPF